MTPNPCGPQLGGPTQPYHSPSLLASQDGAAACGAAEWPARTANLTFPFWSMFGFGPKGSLSFSPFCGLDGWSGFGFVSDLVFGDPVQRKMVQTRTPPNVRFHVHWREVLFVCRYAPDPNLASDWCLPSTRNRDLFQSNHANSKTTL